LHLSIFNDKRIKNKSAKTVPCNLFPVPYPHPKTFSADPNYVGFRPSTQPTNINLVTSNHPDLILEEN